MDKLVHYILFVSIVIFASCVRDDKYNSVDPNDTLRNSTYNLSVLEPSDLTFTLTGNSFYSVSDNTGKIYEISKTGSTIKAFDFTGDDLEGICIDNSNGDIYVAEESTNHIIRLSSTGELIQTITLSGYQSSDVNSGFEGVSKNADTLYIVKEKNPGLLIKYNMSTNNWTSSTLTFALDYSSISYDATDNSLWILSDESHSLFHCNLKGKPISKQTVGVSQPEGVAIDHSSGYVWIVGDSDKKLFKIVLKQINL